MFLLTLRHWRRTPLGTEPRLAAAWAEAALSPNVAFAISPMPASEPRMLIASIGSMMIFWFGESASWLNALIYCRR